MREYSYRGLEVDDIGLLIKNKIAGYSMNKIIDLDIKAELETIKVKASVINIFTILSDYFWDGERNKRIGLSHGVITEVAHVVNKSLLG